MSRTDKDRPYWVKSNDKTEKYRVAYHDHTGRRGDECTIDEPEEHPSSWRGRGGRWYSPCSHYIHLPHICQPHGTSLRDFYWVPSRAEERDYTTRAIKDYNTFGEVDEDYFLQEKTLNGPYGGGWWD
jgi:hypothetical protein